MDSSNKIGFELKFRCNMNGRQVKVKDDNTDYVIYYPYPLTYSPPISTDIPDEGCQVVSIDPAIKNFALRIEKRYRTSFVETVYMVKVDFSQYGDVSESTGTTTIDPRIIAAATSLFMQCLPLFQDTRIVMIERQMAVNYKATRMFQHILTFFLMVVSTFKYPCIIMDISPKLKGRVLGAPKGINHAQMKVWGIEKALEILAWRNDQVAIQIIKQHRGKSKTKADDLADTIIQAEAWFILLGGVHTQPPRVMTFAPDPFTHSVPTGVTLDLYLTPQISIQGMGPLVPIQSRGLNASNLPS